MAKNYLKSALLVLTSVLLVATASLAFTSCKKKADDKVSLTQNYAIENDDNVVEDPFGPAGEGATTAETDSKTDSGSSSSKSGSSSSKSGSNSSKSSNNSGSSSKKSSSSSSKKSSSSSSKKKSASGKKNSGSNSNKDDNEVNTDTTKPVQEVTDENGDSWTGYY